MQNRAEDDFKRALSSAGNHYLDDNTIRFFKSKVQLVASDSGHKPEHWVLWETMKSGFNKSDGRIHKVSLFTFGDFDGSFYRSADNETLYHGGKDGVGIATQAKRAEKAFRAATGKQNPARRRGGHSDPLGEIVTCSPLRRNPSPMLAVRGGVEKEITDDDSAFQAAIYVYAPNRRGESECIAAGSEASDLTGCLAIAQRHKGAQVWMHGKRVDNGGVASALSPSRSRSFGHAVGHHAKAAVRGIADFGRGVFAGARSNPASQNNKRNTMNSHAREGKTAKIFDRKSPYGRKVYLVGREWFDSHPKSIKYSKDPDVWITLYKDDSGLYGGDKWCIADRTEGGYRLRIGKLPQGGTDSKAYPSLWEALEAARLPRSEDSDDAYAGSYYGLKENPMNSHAREGKTAKIFDRKSPYGRKVYLVGREWFDSHPKSIKYSKDPDVWITLYKDDSGLYGGDKWCIADRTEGGYRLRIGKLPQGGTDSKAYPSLWEALEAARLPRSEDSDDAYAGSYYGLKENPMNSHAREGKTAKIFDRKSPYGRKVYLVGREWFDSHPKSIKYSKDPDVWITLYKDDSGLYGGDKWCIADRTEGGYRLRIGKLPQGGTDSKAYPSLWEALEAARLPRSEDSDDAYAGSYYGLKENPMRKTKDDGSPIAVAMVAIAQDETDCYTIAPEDQPYIKRILGCYAFDRNSRTFLASSQPSYWLKYLYTSIHLTPKGEALDDDARDALDQMYASEGYDDNYYGAHSIDRQIEQLSKDNDGRVYIAKEHMPEDTSDEAREALFEELWEDLRGNWHVS